MRVVLLGIILSLAACSKMQNPPRPNGPRYQLLSVASVWAVHARRYCDHTVTRSIETALRVFQGTPITNTSRCMPEPEEVFIQHIGCGRNARAEIISLVRPARFNDRMGGAGAVFRIIAYTTEQYAPRLHIALGRRYGAPLAPNGPKILYESKFSPIDFLRLEDGECSMAAPTSEVPYRD